MCLDHNIEDEYKILHIYTSSTFAPLLYAWSDINMVFPSEFILYIYFPMFVHKILFLARFLIQIMWYKDEGGKKINYNKRKFDYFIDNKPYISALEVKFPP